MKRILTKALPKARAHEGPFASASAVVRRVVSFPFKISLRIALRTVQVLLALFVVVLHPQAKWLWKLIVESSLVQRHIRPVVQTLYLNYYEPYFAYLKQLSPYWATFSIALPLAILEPAKLYATILIAERPKIGIFLWLLLQGLSFVLIDKTWSAVRPQSRKIWLVSRLHGWVWLNVSYGKHWIKSSRFYEVAARWKEQTRRKAHALLLRFTRRWRNARFEI